METAGKVFFFSSQVNGDRILLSEEECKHLAKAYRKKQGDTVWVLSGDGFTHKARIEEIKRDHAVLQSLESTFSERKMQHELWISVLKHQDRLEWLVEKCTELELGRIRLLLCAHTEKSQVNMERLRKLCVAAAKQSGNPYLPELYAPVALFDESLHSGGAEVMLAHCRTAGLQDLFSLPKAAHSAVLIGPEGDFSAEEVERLLCMHYKEVSLGTARLRSETAGLKAAVWLSLRS